MKTDSKTVMNFIGKISTYIIISLIITLLSYYLESSFFRVFLDENIILLLITLLAINTATYGFVLSKISDLELKHDKADFAEAKNQIKRSLKIQFGLIMSAIVVQIISTSNIFTTESTLLICTFEFLLVFIFVFALDLLRDTGFAIFEF